MPNRTTAALPHLLPALVRSGTWRREGRGPWGTPLLGGSSCWGTQEPGLGCDRPRKVAALINTGKVRNRPDYARLQYLLAGTSSRTRCGFCLAGLSCNSPVSTDVAGGPCKAGSKHPPAHTRPRAGNTSGRRTWDSPAGL